MAEFTNCPNCGTLIREYSTETEDALQVCRDCGQIFCGHCSSYGCPNCGSYNCGYTSVDEVNYLKNFGKIAGGKSKDILDDLEKKKLEEEYLQAVENARNNLSRQVDNAVGRDGSLMLVNRELWEKGGQFMGFNQIKELFITTAGLRGSESFIGANCFSACANLKSVKIGYGITEIKRGAFMTCKNLQKVHLPETLKEIGVLAFQNCPNLEEINIPDGLQKIGEAAFHACPKLKTLEVMPTVQVDPYFASTGYGNNDVRLIDKTTGQEIILTPPPPKTPVKNLYGNSNAGSTYNSQSSGCFSTIFVMCLILSTLIFVW